ncbi:MAG: hypothetical protein FMNOHCHN_01675 [Ignavibacteriaceae bacterium]|nr:hypothetical protein [Ignavibacteriaceae bacterium]
MDEMKDRAPSTQTAAKTLLVALKILKLAGGQLSSKEILAKLKEQLTFSEWENFTYEKTGYVRWETIFRFYSIGLVKAGFIRKTKRIWYLTDEGEKSIALGEIGLVNAINKAYREWASNEKEETELPKSEEIEIVQKLNLEVLEEKAIEGIKEFINQKNPYEFQDLVAALLRAMKYHTPFISPKGKDGGIDIIAYHDPLGATTPRIKVQVKHKPDISIRVDEIRSLTGLLNKDGDVGLFVTSGTFTNEAERFARDNHIHVKLIDIDTFISLWREYYGAMTDEEKNLLPLQAVYFLGSNE